MLFALAADLRLGDAEAVDPAPDDVDRDVERARLDLAHGLEHDRDAALEVETEQRRVALHQGDADEHDDDGEEPEELRPEASDAHARLMTRGRRPRRRRPRRRGPTGLVRLVLGQDPLGDRAAGDLHDHPGRDLDVERLVVEAARPVPKTPPVVMISSSTWTAAMHLAAELLLAALGPDDQEVERRDQDQQVDRDDHRDTSGSGAGGLRVEPGDASEGSGLDGVGRETGGAEREAIGATPGGACDQASPKRLGPALAGTASPRWAYAAAVATRPRGVRRSSPHLSRNGS